VKVGRPYAVPAGTDPREGTRLLGATLQAMLDELQARPVHRPVRGEKAPWHPAHLGGGAPTAAEAALVETTVPRRAVRPDWRPGAQTSRVG
jgi:hypothetical protein